MEISVIFFSVFVNISVVNMQLFLFPGEEPSVKIMCDAQCEAMCMEIGESCEHICQPNQPQKWQVRCSDNGNCFGTGFCYALANYSHSNGYVPPKPVVMISRDAFTQEIKVQWNLVSSPSKVIYVIEWDQYIKSRMMFNVPTLKDSTTKITWVSLGLVFGDVYRRIKEPDVCSRPLFRVAAVSRYGSKWFTSPVKTPALIPGPVTNITMSNNLYSNGEFHFDLTWSPPQGWTSSDIILYKWQETDFQRQCPTYLNSIQVFYSQQTSQKMGVRIPEYAAGCNVTIKVTPISRCSPNTIGFDAYFTVRLDGSIFPECTPQVHFNPPGNVENISIYVFPSTDGPLVFLNWKPPTDLGSAGRVGHYHVQWGKVTFDSLGIGILHDTKNKTVDGNVLRTDIHLGKVNSSDTYGVQIMPSAPHHSIKYFVSAVQSFSPVPADWPSTNNMMSNGNILKDSNGVIIVIIPKTRSVRLYLPMLRKRQKNNVESFRVQWGRVHNDSRAQELRFDVQDTRDIKKDVMSLDLEGLHPKKTYGVKVVTMYKNQTELSDDATNWDKAELHTFTMPDIIDDSTPGTGSNTVGPTNAGNTGQDEGAKSGVIAIAVILPVLAIAVVAFFLFYVARKRRKKLSYLEGRERGYDSSDLYSYYFQMGQQSHSRLDTSQLVSPAVVADKWELPHSCLRFGQVLGSGAFGQVIKGLITYTMLIHRGVPLPQSENQDGIYATVAIKVLQDGCESRYRQDFLQEIHLMKEIGHHANVVSMLGCCTLQDPVCLIVEHIPHGDLLHYLKQVRQRLQVCEEDVAHYENREVEHLSPLDLLSFARQIAMGMEFLSEKGYVHRDLAARNILVGNNNTVKIGDFGLTRYVYDDKVYVNRRGGKLPLKWMSIEAIFELTFSTASDVWSYGIVLFEIVTLGGTPYPTISNKELLQELQSGYRMGKPENCTQGMYQLMCACWQNSPQDRPSFTDLRHSVEKMIEDCSGNDYLDLQLDMTRDYYLQESSDQTLHEQTSSASEHSFCDDSMERPVSLPSALGLEITDGCPVEPSSTILSSQLEDLPLDSRSEATQVDSLDTSCQNSEDALRATDLPLEGMDKFHISGQQEINSVLGLPCKDESTHSVNECTSTKKEGTWKKLQRPCLSKEYLDEVDLADETCRFEGYIDANFDDVFAEEQNDDLQSDISDEFCSRVPFRTHLPVSYLRNDAESGNITSDMVFPFPCGRFVRTGSEVSTTSVDSGLPQSPVQLEPKPQSLGSVWKFWKRNSSIKSLNSSYSHWRKIRKNSSVSYISGRLPSVVDKDEDTAAAPHV